MGPLVGELESACRTPQVSWERVRLDLLGLTCVDALGDRLLACLIRDEASITACSGFVAERLHIRRALMPGPGRGRTSSWFPKIRILRRSPMRSFLRLTTRT